MEAQQNCSTHPKIKYLEYNYIKMKHLSPAQATDIGAYLNFWDSL